MGKPTYLHSTCIMLVGLAAHAIILFSDISDSPNVEIPSNLQA